MLDLFGAPCFCFVILLLYVENWAGGWPYVYYVRVRSPYLNLLCTSNACSAQSKLSLWGRPLHRTKSHSSSLSGASSPRL